MIEPRAGVDAEGNYRPIRMTPGPWSQRDTERHVSASRDVGGRGAVLGRPRRRGWGRKAFPLSGHPLRKRRGPDCRPERASHNRDKKGALTNATSNRVARHVGATTLSGFTLGYATLVSGRGLGPAQGKASYVGPPVISRTQASSEATGRESAVRRGGHHAGIAGARIAGRPADQHEDHLRRYRGVVKYPTPLSSRSPTLAHAQNVSRAAVPRNRVWMAGVLDPPASVPYRPGAGRFR